MKQKTGLTKAGKPGGKSQHLCNFGGGVFDFYPLRLPSAQAHTDNKMNRWRTGGAMGTEEEENKEGDSESQLRCLALPEAFLSHWPVSPFLL